MMLWIFFDNEDDISPSLDLSPIYDTAPNEDSYLVQVTEQPTGFVDRDTNNVSDRIAGQTEGGLSGPQQDGHTSDQEEGGQEEDSEFEFVAEDHAAIINRTWDVDSIVLWTSCLSINRGSSQTTRSTARLLDWSRQLVDLPLPDH
jgi:hypothetical protein